MIEKLKAIDECKAGVVPLEFLKIDEAFGFISNHPENMSLIVDKINEIVDAYNTLSDEVELAKERCDRTRDTSMDWTD